MYITKLVEQIPHTTNTLSFYNLNIPFIVANKNQRNIDKTLEKLEKDIKNFRLYTSDKYISIHTNGVGGLFTFGYDGISMHSESRNSFLSTGYLKSDTLEGSLRANEPLNFFELKRELENEGFLRKSQVFTNPISATDVIISNFMSLEAMSLDLFTKTYNTSTENGATVSTTDLRVDSSSNLDHAAIDIAESLTFVLPKHEEIEQVEAIGSSLGKVVSENSTIFSIDMEDGYAPANLYDIETVHSASETSYLINTEMVDPLKIENPSSVSPVSKGKIIEISDKYVSKIDKEIRDIKIDRYVGVLDSEHLLSYEEADAYIEEFFKGMEAPGIDNISDFEEYLKNICDIDNSFVGIDFEIPGGVVYIDFDYDSMFSIFNETALERILFLDVGEWNEGDGQSFRAANYFSDQKEINTFLAYAQQMGYHVDLSGDKIANVFGALRAVVADVCNYSPSVAEIMADPEIPVVPEVGSFYVIIPPIILEGPLLRAIWTLVKPVYTPIFKFYTIIPPLFTIERMLRPIWTLVPPIPTPVYSSYLLIPPLFGSAAINRAPSIIVPTNDGKSCPELRLFTKQEGSTRNLLFYESKNSCDERYRVLSNRSFNMLEMSAIAETIIDNVGDYYISEYGCPITGAEYAAVMLSEIACKISSEIDFVTNIDIGLMLFAETLDEHGNPVERTNAEESCTFSKSISIGGSVSKDFSIALRTMGRVLHSNGSITGTEIARHTEMITTTSSVHIPHWGMLGDPEFEMAVSSIVTDKAEEIKDYIRDHKVNDIRELGEIYDLTPSNIGNSAFSHIGNGDIPIRTAYEALKSTTKTVMLEYAVLEDPNGATSFNGGGDPLGFDLSVDFNDEYSETVSTAATRYTVRKMYFSNIQDGIVDLHFWNPDRGVSYDDINQTLKTRFLTKDDSYVTFTEEGIFLEVFLGMGTVEAHIYTIGQHTASFATETIDDISWLVVRSGSNTMKVAPSVYGTIGNGILRMEVAGCVPHWSETIISERSMVLGNPLVPELVTGMRSSFSGFGGGSGGAGGGGGAGSGGGTGSFCLDCTKTGSSGIDLRKYDNISDPASFSPDVPIDYSVPPTEIPGSFLMNLTMKAARTSSIPKDDGERYLWQEKADLQLPIAFGIIDGEEFSGGDILSQKLTQDEIDGSAVGSTKVYCGPCDGVKPYLSLSETPNGSFMGKIDIKSIIETAPHTDAGCTKLVDLGIATNAWSVNVNPSKEDEMVPAMFKEDGTLITQGTINITSFGYTAMRTSFKHASANAEYPIATGGDSMYQKDLVVGRRLVSSAVPSGFMATPYPGDLASATVSLMESLAQPDVLSLFMATDGIIVVIPKIASPVDGANKRVVFREV